MNDKLKWEQFYMICENADNETLIWLLNHVEDIGPAHEVAEVIEQVYDTGIALSLMKKRIEKGATISEFMYYGILNYIETDDLVKLITQNNWVPTMEELLDIIDLPFEDDYISKHLWRLMKEDKNNITAEALEASTEYFEEEEYDEISTLIPLTSENQEILCEITFTLSDLGKRIIVFRLLEKKFINVELFRALIYYFDDDLMIEIIKIVKKMKRGDLLDIIKEEYEYLFEVNEHVNAINSGNIRVSFLEKVVLGYIGYKVLDFIFDDNKA